MLSRSTSYEAARARFGPDEALCLAHRGRAGGKELPDHGLDVLADLADEADAERHL